jgi:hypothetical protein
MPERIGFAEAAKIIGCTRGTLRVRYRAWKVPYYKIGSMVTFSPQELYTWIESKAHNQPVATEE